MLLYGPDAVRQMPGSLVGKVVPGHRSDDRVLELHQPDGLRHPPGLFPIVALGAALGNVAESASPGANIS